MKKIISIIACVCILLSAMVFSASAAETSAQITFDDLAKRTSISTTQQVWEENGITVTNDKGASTSNVNEKYYNPLRCYKSSTVTIEYPGMTTIVIDSVTYDDNDYAGAWVNSFDTTLGTAVANDGDVTITLNNAADSLTFASMAAQGRAYSITVYAGDAKPPVEEEEDTTPTTTVTLVDAPVAGAAYKYGMIQGNVSETDVYYLDGAMSSYYMNTTTDVAAAIDVYLEEVEGGYSLYAMVDGAKKYINMVVSGTYVNGKYEDAASTVYTFNAEKKALVAIVNDVEYWIGTRNDKTYTTVGPVKTSYNGFYCQLYTVTVEEDDVPPATDGDEETDGFDPTGKTAAEIVDAAYALAPGTAFTNAATLTGVITSVDTEFSSQYNNVTVTIAVEGASADKPIKCFRLKGEGADLIAVGDKITVTGIIKNYQHSSGDTEVEFDAGCTLDAYVKGGVIVTPPAEEENKEETKEEVKTEFGVVSNPVVGTAYKFGMVQGNLKKTFYVTGEMDGFYMATTDDVSKAADVYLEKAEGGYYIYVMVGGAKKYMGIEEAMGSDGKTHINAVYSDAPKSIFTYNTTVKTFVTKVGDKEYGFGTRNDREYKTVSPSSTEYVENFVCQFYGMTVVNGDKSPIAPSTGDNVGAVVAMAVAAAAVLVASKKR